MGYRFSAWAGHWGKRPYRPPEEEWDILGAEDDDEASRDWLTKTRI